MEKDIHEKDTEYMNDSYNVAVELSKEYNWTEIKCIKDGEIRTIDDIHEEIFEIIKKEIEK